MNQIEKFKELLKRKRQPVAMALMRARIGGQAVAIGYGV